MEERKDKKEESEVLPPPEITPGESSTTHDATSDASVKQELYSAADVRITELNKVGVAQGRTDINEPRRDHLPVLITMEEFEDWLKHAEEYAVDRRLKGGGDRIVGSRIDLKDILQDVSTQDGSMKKCRHAILLAPAGMGKTTLIRWIARYGRDGLLEKLQGKLIIVPDFRTLPAGKKCHPSQAFLGNMFRDQNESKMKRGYLCMMENSDEVIFLIDSLDTLDFDFENERPRIGHNTEALPEDILHNLFSGDLFPNSDIISTSRPHKVRNMHPNVRPDRCILIDGLEEESVQDLIGEFLGEEKGKEVKRHIKTECPDVGPLLTMPLFLVLAMIGFVAGGFMPVTMSGILIKYYLSLILSDHVHVKNIREALVKLMPMSYEGICQGRVLFRIEDLKRFKINTNEIIDLGILIPLSTGNYLFSKLMQNEGFYLYFNHQTLQECLAALNVLSVDFEKFRKIIHTNLFKPNFFVVRRILCGTLLNPQVLEFVKELTQIPDIDRKKTILLESLRSEVKQQQQDGNGKKLLDLFIDLNEGKTGTTELIRKSVKNINLENVSFTPSDVQATASIMKQCDYLQMVDLNNCNLTADKMEILTRTLMQSNLQLREVDISFNRNLGSVGFCQLGKLVQNHAVQLLSALECNIKSEHIEMLSRGLSGGQLKELNICFNNELGPDGFHSLGKLVQDHGINILNASHCGSSSEHIEKFSRGLGKAKIDVLNLKDSARYTPFLLDIVWHVEKTLYLTRWKIDESEQQQLQNELDRIGSPSLAIEIRTVDQENVQLKALTGATSSENDAEIESTPIQTQKQPDIKTEGRADAEEEAIVVSENISPSGGEIRTVSATIKFSPDTFQEESNTHASTPTGKHDIPDKYLSVSPTLFCKSSRRLTKEAKIHIRTWASTENGKIMLTVLHKKDGENDQWTVVKSMRLCDVRDKVVEFDTLDLGYFSLVIDNLPNLLCHVTFDTVILLNYDCLGNFYFEFKVVPHIDSYEEKTDPTVTPYPLFTRKLNKGDEIWFEIFSTKTQGSDFDVFDEIFTIGSDFLSGAPRKFTAHLPPNSPASDIIHLKSHLRLNKAKARMRHTKIPMPKSTESLPLQDPIKDKDELDEIIMKNLTRPVTTAKFIGREGGVIQVLRCMLKFPPDSFDEDTMVSLTVKAQDYDGPDGCWAISPKLKCNTSGVQFKHFATIKLPIYCREVAERAIIMCKKSNDGEWKEVKCQYREDDGALIFQVQHLCTWGAWFRSIWPFSGSIMAENHLYFKRSPEGVQLCGITCIGEEQIRTSCVQALKENGFKNASALHDNVKMKHGEEIKYKLEVSSPPNTQIHPTNEIVHGQRSILSAKYLKAEFCFSPAPQPDIRSAIVDYTLTAHNRSPLISALLLQWPEELAPHIRPPHILPPLVHRPPDEPSTNPAGGNQNLTDAVPSVHVLRSTPEAYDAHLHDETNDNYRIDPHKQKGRVLIINNDFRGTRQGSERDVKNMKELWTGLGFAVVAAPNLTAQGMLHSCEQFAQNAIHISVIVVIIMSHGGRTGNGEFLDGEDNQRLPISSVIDQFTSTKCPHLQDIPKLFIFEACRVDVEDSARDTADARGTVRSARDKANMLITFAS